MRTEGASRGRVRRADRGGVGTGVGAEQSERQRADPSGPVCPPMFTPIRPQIGGYIVGRPALIV